MSVPKKEPRLYWEDLSVGETRDLGSLSPTAEEIVAFASQWDPQPFHLDPEAAKDSVFGALCASGWHTCAMAMRLMVTNFLHETSSLGSPGLESLKWLKPVFPGDTLTLRHTITEKRVCPSLAEISTSTAVPRMPMVATGVSTRMSPFFAT